MAETKMPTVMDFITKVLEPLLKTWGSRKFLLPVLVLLAGFFWASEVQKMEAWKIVALELPLIAAIIVEGIKDIIGARKGKKGEEEGSPGEEKPKP
jgi:hypothetical protein